MNSNNKYQELSDQAKKEAKSLLVRYFRTAHQPQETFLQGKNITEIEKICDRLVDSAFYKVRELFFHQEIAIGGLEDRLESGDRPSSLTKREYFIGQALIGVSPLIAHVAFNKMVIGRMAVELGDAILQAMQQKQTEIDALKHANPVNEEIFKNFEG